VNPGHCERKISLTGWCHVAGADLLLEKNYCWLVADKLCEQGRYTHVTSFKNILFIYCVFLNHFTI
jgi:hypothetical protein